MEETPLERVLGHGHRGHWASDRYRRRRGRLLGASAGLCLCNARVAISDMSHCSGIRLLCSDRNKTAEYHGLNG